EDWIIVPDELWSKVQKIREKRQPQKTKREYKHTIIKSTKGPLLFVGMARCGHCGSALTTTYNYKRYENRYGEKNSKQVPVYRCSGKALQKTPCTGQTIY